MASRLTVERALKALVFISSFASLTQVAVEDVWWLPVLLLLRDRYANIGKIGQISAKFLQLHGEADDLLPDNRSYMLATQTFREDMHAADRSN